MYNQKQTHILKINEIQGSVNQRDEWVVTRNPETGDDVFDRKP